MREVFASINYVINKLEEKNLFKIAQEGHDIFAAVYRFVGQDGELVRSDDDKSDENYESASPNNMFENDLYSPMDKNKQRKWRVKSEPSEYGPSPASSAAPSATETPSAETFTPETPESASVTITNPSSYSRTEGTSSESSSSTSTPSGSGPSFNMGSGEASVDPTKVEYFDIGTLIDIVDHLVRNGATSIFDLIDKLAIEGNTMLNALPILMKLGVIKKTDYKYEIAKPQDQVFKILTEYMKHHQDKQPKDEIIDVDVEDPNEVKQIGERNSPTSSYEPTSTGLLSDSNLLPSSNSPRMLGKKVYPTSMAEIRKTQEKLDVIVKELDKILRMPNDRKTKGVFTNFLSNKDLVDIVSDPNFEQNYSINSDTMMNIEFIHYPGENIVGLKINGKPVIQFGKRR